MSKILRIVRFKDLFDRTIFWDTVFFSELSEAELQKKAEEIVEEFEDDGYDDWTYDEIVDGLKKRGLIEFPDFEVDWCTILI